MVIASPPWICWVLPLPDITKPPLTVSASPSARLMSLLLPTALSEPVPLSPITLRSPMAKFTVDRLEFRLTDVKMSESGPITMVPSPLPICMVRLDPKLAFIPASRDWLA